MHKNNGICQLGIVPVRKKPSHRSEMVTQLLHGEEYSFSFFESDAEWLAITTSMDHYEGYIAANQHTKLSVNLVGESLLVRDFQTNDQNFPNILPTGSRISQITKETLNIQRKHIFELAASSQLSSANLVKSAKSFLNSPYLWGGRTSFGIDCSGLVQIVYLVNGIELPRDASQQIDVGKKVDLQEAQNGDLAFFNNKSGTITHVGIMLEEESQNIQIIHASGKVRIDSLDRKGIYIVEENKYTHQLHSIKRIINENQE